ncbi:MAG: isoprenyl transferase [Candidatus Bipolaricaulia bacterium]
METVEIISTRLRRIKEHDLPQHIAIIMDGNGRWARYRNRLRTEGHRAGVRTARRIVQFAAEDLNIKYLTLFAFSKENWKRPRVEVEFLMNLLADFLDRELESLLRLNIRLHILGELSDLPRRVQKRLRDAVELSRKNGGLNLNLAVNYGSRQEIVAAVRRLIEDLKHGQLNEADLDVDRFADYLYTKGIPDPDLVIRTSGEQRLSNFLLWQIAYTEFWVTDTLWPDFSETELLQGIEDFQQRKRRFGRVEA